MMRQSEQLEREAEETRHQLAGAVDELRYRISPGQLVDQLTDYAREGPVAEFLRNMIEEIRENPLPLLWIGTGLAWLVISSSLSRRRRSNDGEREAVSRHEAGPIKVEPIPKPVERQDWAVPLPQDERVRA